MTPTTRHIHITGIVQGVGFRPFIYNLALTHRLRGWVRNSASGVDIEVTGEFDQISPFITDISDKAPPLAQIDSIVTQTIPLFHFNAFEILTSENQPSDFIPVSPDMAVCPDCQRELFDPQDRRYRYPFVNCTNCGPRITIIQDIPYDRVKTTMAGFEMCPDCKTEYSDPRDRRFHAQPVACPICGPQVWLEVEPGTIQSKKDMAIHQARQMLAAGKIVAIKGLGGYHLACDAANPEAVARLRQRKHRPSKPFALMAFDTATIRRHVEISPEAERLLKSSQAPIVLLSKKPGSTLADNVAPGQSTLGFMLPYTPLHLLLMEPACGIPPVLVMTSGNLSEEPVITEDVIAREKLGVIADAFLMHNRPIYLRIDDSVFAMADGMPYPIRRARGYAPNPIRLQRALPQILAVGPQMKNTFCLTRDKYAFLSHYIGEMDNYETYRDFRMAIPHYETLFRIQPEAIAYDLHPAYRTTHYALERAEAEHLPQFAIQHHHAHLAAGMIENGLSPETTVAGLIFDGTGYGSDGTIWGGEVLVGNCAAFQRPYYLKPVPLPGGDAAILKPARMALSILRAYGLPWDPSLAPVKALTDLEIAALQNQLEKSINTPLTSSMGRLFDAVAALLGVRETITYEAQAAIELEAVADRDELGYYPWRIRDQQIDVKPMLESLLGDHSKGVATPIIAARFHQSIAQLSLALALIIQEDYGIQQIVLSGGVWQNIYLLERTIELFRQHGITPLIHKQIPPNDGCVAFGQAMIAAYRYQQSKE